MTFKAPGSPASLEERAANVERAASVAERLRKAGWVPFLPHAHYSAWSEALGGMVFEGRSGHDEVMTQCLKWVSVCNVLVRLPGYSPGTDLEVSHAKRNGIPVYELEELHKLIRPQEWR